ncbi:MAG: DUF2382 domain-containing protein [Blastocatellia bacterium]|nr:DUF2382 domain-containing protein [Blastocatellia bacterium]
MTHTVVGLFDERQEAQKAMNELIQKGFVKENIDLSNRKATGTTPGSTSQGSEEGIGDRISNFFSSLFDGDSDTARNYTNAADEADAILTVHAESKQRAEEARDIFDRHNAMDVDERSSRQGQHRGATGAATGATGRDRDNEGKTIPVVEEHLNVGKRSVETGGVRIRSRIVEKPVEETVRLREEHVSVNRRPVDREVTESDVKNFRPGEMEITEHAEVPVVGKQARVVEEIEVSKDVSERNETVRDTARKTEVDVDEHHDKEKSQHARGHSNR